MWKKERSDTMVGDLAKWCGGVVIEMTQIKACVCRTLVATMI